MRPLIAAVALAMVVATGACWYPAQPYHQSDARPPDAAPDARPGPLACNNQPLPPPDPMSMQAMVSGTVRGAISNTGMIATIQAFQNTNDPGKLTELNHTTSRGDGSFMLPIATGGGRVNAYLKVTATGFLESDFYPSITIGGDVSDLDLRLFRGIELSGLLGQLGVNPVNSGEAVFLVAAVDCTGTKLGGVSVSTDPPGDHTQVHYFSVDSQMTITPNPDANATDVTTGAAFAANVPIGPTTIGGTVISPTDPSKTLLMRPVTIYQPVTETTALIQVEIAP